MLLPLRKPKHFQRDVDSDDPSVRSQRFGGGEGKVSGSGPKVQYAHGVVFNGGLDRFLPPYGVQMQADDAVE